MNDWDKLNRHLGPADADSPPADSAAEETSAFGVPTPLQAHGAPPPVALIEPLWPGAGQAALVPSPPAPDEEGWTDDDEFNPRYCTVCHKKIPHIVSERQEMCNACYARSGHNIALPVTGGEAIGVPSAVMVHCPMCASADVEREWKNDWVSNAVDIVSDAAALGSMLFGSIGMYRGAGRLDWNHDVGHVKVMRHRCLSCGHTWVE